MTVSIVITYQTYPHTIEAGHQALADLIRLVVAKETDCLQIRIHQDTEDPSKIMLWEEWTSAEAFRGPHMTTPHLTAFRERARELYVGPPNLSFWRETGRVGSSH